jgi:uncharacterized membrane protein YjgN (DUF898 family)
VRAPPQIIGTKCRILLLANVKVNGNGHGHHGEKKGNQDAAFEPELGACFGLGNVVALVLLLFLVVVAVIFVFVTILPLAPSSSSLSSSYSRMS